jgi:itaconate CoA-transferase
VLDARTGPLAGLTVVVLEQAVAAPYATMRLADGGATVLKIERPEGDFARGYDTAAGGQSSYFVWLNRGKRSVALDLAQGPDRDRLAEMIARADVFVQNLRAGAAMRLGFDPAELCAKHPRLIACSISGFRDDGPRASRKAYDLLIQAESGLASVTGGPEAPARVGISVVDIGTGATAHAAILEALIARGLTGRGADIRISLFDVAAEWMTVPLLNHEAGNSPQRLGLAHPSIAPYGVFVSADGHKILLSIQSEREWSVLCRDLLAEPELAADPRFATNVARVRHRDATDRKVGAAIARRSRDQAVSLLDEAGIACAVVNDLDGLSHRPELRRISVETPNGPVHLPAPAPRIMGQEPAYGAVPAIGDCD